MLQYFFSGLTSEQNKNIFWRKNMSFGSPACDYAETPLDLNRLLITHPAGTYFVRMQGKNFEPDGIFENDILIVDRAKTAVSGSLAICELNGELHVRRITFHGHTPLISTASSSARTITPNETFSIWGTVTSVIRQLG